MRILTTLFIAITLLSFVLMGQVSTVDGQSQRKTPPQATTHPDQTKAAFVLDPKREEYQLIFSKIPETEKVHRALGSWERREHHAVSFSNDLTHVGAQGYRLISIAFSPRVAVLRREDHQYEYAVVQILSRRQAFPNDPKFSLTYEPWARKGFRVADYVVYSDWCENNIGNDGIAAPADCFYSSMMVLERRVDAKLPHAYDIVNGPLTFSRKKLEAELLEELDAGHTNLHPTHLLTKSQVLRESASSVDNLALADYEIEIVAGGDMRKRTNALAQQGYRLFIRPLLLQAAVMHRKKGLTAPASYTWVREKDIEQELARLQEQGAIYRMNYGCDTSFADRWPMIFEQPSVKDGKQREYKVLEIELKQIGNGEIEFQLSSGANGTQELQRLTKDGFIVRELFNCYLSDKKNKPSRFKILLERVR